MSLFFRQGGTPHAPAAVFLHGATVSSWMWADVLDALPDVETFAPDLPGLARSAAAGPFSVEAAAAQMAAFIAQHAMGGAAHVVGHSLGGAVAAQLLAAHPEVVRSVTLIGVTTRPIPFERLFVEMTLRLSAWTRAPRALAVQAGALGVPERFRGTFVQEQLNVSPAVLRAVLEAGVGFRVPDAVAHSTAPALVLVGAREGTLNVRSAQELTARIPGAQGYLVPRGGHAWVGRQQDLLVRTLRAWWGGAPLPDTLGALQPGRAVAAVGTRS